MRIALYYPWLYLTSGVERTILETVKKSSHEYTIFTNHFDKKNTYAELANCRIIQLRKVPVKRDIFSVLKAALVIATQKLQLKKFDCLIVHSDGLADLILLRNSEIPVLCYCHTPLRPVFDRVYRKRSLRSKNLLERVVFLACSFLFVKIDRLLWKRYTYTFFNSEETLKRARRGKLLRNIRDSSFSILHPGVDLEKNQPIWEYNLYFFLPGRIMWTKNIELGIDSFLRFKEKRNNFGKFELIIAGQVDEKSKRYFNDLKLLSKNRNDIYFITNPTEFKMRDLYKKCWAVLSTSFNEDWGLTLLEAGAFGKPAIALNKGGPIESQKEGVTGYLVNESAGSFAEAMSRLAGSKRLVKQLGKNAYKNSKKYSVQSFIKNLDRSIIKLVKTK